MCWLSWHHVKHEYLRMGKLENKCKNENVTEFMSSGGVLKLWCYLTLGYLFFQKEFSKDKWSIYQYHCILMML